MIANDFMQRLASRRVSLTLILLLLCICVTGALVPQKSLLEPEEYAAWVAAGGVHDLWLKLGFTRIFSTWYFLTVMALFFVSTLAAMIVRVRALLRREKPEVSAAAISREPFSAIVPGVSPETLKLRVSGFCWSEGNCADGRCLTGTRFGFARWSVVLLHTSLLLLILGVLASQETYFRGYMKLGVGQDEQLDEAGFFQQDKGMLAPPLPRGLKITLLSFDNRYREAGYLPDIAADLLLEGAAEGPLRTRLLRYNTVRYGGTDLYLSVRSGFGVILHTERRDGGRASGYVTFHFPEKGKNPQVQAEVPGSDMQVNVEFLSRNHKYYDIDDIESPAIRMRFMRNGRLVAERLIRPGERTEVEGISYTFGKIDYWCDIAATRDPAISLIFAGFAASALALVFFALFPTTEIRLLEIRGTDAVHLGVRCERFRAVAERVFEQITKEKTT
ncbi:cytochrome c biogenesis protein ResB [Geobacter argillaceus]|uniref:Cytochrome c biogenesis protein ResB n=1 Tax=Geobacter argillaceus TaxID=345631 RepID=A0A562V0B6_9BACT|nr:cytochrome c biogenesis protein ResB [Geobacter argillaceus]TWJ11334.1 cytochrome c biogenesis protein ResB [Geobacter argillaceus]